MGMPRERLDDSDAPQPAETPGNGASSGRRLLWRREEPVIDRTDPRNPRVLRGGMFAPQRAWWDLPNFIKVFVAGYGSGKTIIGSKRAISLTLVNAPAPVAVVSPTFPMARETVIITIDELLAGKRRLLGRDVFDYEYKQQTHVFNMRYGERRGRLLCLTGERPERLKGPNLGAVVMDEPFIMKEQVFKEMNARIRHPMAVQRELDMLGTPEELNWGYDLCIGDTEDKYDVGLVRASTRSNLALDVGYVKRLEAVFDEKAVQAYVEGEFVSLSTGMVYYSFDPTENVVSLPRVEGVELGVGMDFNVNPMAACVFWRSGDHLHFFDEIELPNADTEYLCSELHSRGYHAAGLRNIYPDASGAARHSASPGGKSDFHYIREAGFEVQAPRANPLRRDRYNAVNGKLKPKDGKVSLTIEPGCKKLRKYLSLYSHPNMNESEQKAMSHLLDAFSYPVHFIFPIDSDKARELRLRGY